MPRIAIVEDGTTVAAADAPAAPAAAPGADTQPDGDAPHGRFRASLTVEGEWSGDGRQFAVGSLDVRDLPLPMQGTDQTTEFHLGAVNVGHLTSVTKEGNEWIGVGAWANTPDAWRIRTGVREQHYRGVSVDVDNIEWELLVTPELQAEEAKVSDALEAMFEEDGDGELSLPEPETDDEGNQVIPMPEPKMRVTSGRIMGATIIPFPAFQEAQIEDLDVDMPVPEGLTAAATPQHQTGMSDGAWDGAAQEGKLDSPMPTSTANAMYAWIDSGEVADGEVVKAACKFPHHEVGDNGQPGVANLNACAAVVAALNGGRGGTSIPADDVQGVYNHVAKHYRDNDVDPPELNASAEQVEQAGLVAAAAPLRPPFEWFARPNFTAYTPWTITDAGQVFGHLASWQDCHISFPDRCVPPPRSATNYAHYLHGEVVCADGARVPVGQITMDTGHAGHHLSAFEAIAHYDNTGTAAADVFCGEDAYGIWVAGALRSTLAPEQVRACMAAGVSGDWRYIAGNLELVAVLNVNVPGFNRRSPRVSGLVASGRVQSVSIPLQAPRAQVAGPDPATVRRVRALIASAAGRTPAQRRAELRARVHPEV